MKRHSPAERAIHRHNAMQEFARGLAACGEYAKHLSLTLQETIAILSTFNEKPIMNSEALAIIKDQARALAIRQGLACQYARFHDKHPRDDTRAASIEEGRAGEYAVYVDKIARADTYAASVIEGTSAHYERKIGLPTPPSENAA